MVSPQSAAWTVPVIAVSALTGDGVDRFWTDVQDHRRALQTTGEFDEKRRQQRVGWFHALVQEGVVRRFRQDPATAEAFSELEQDVASGTTVATVAARQLLERLG
jgi:LAO/AO transport system kinase